MDGVIVIPVSPVGMGFWILMLVALSGPLFLMVVVMVMVSPGLGEGLLICVFTCMSADGGTYMFQVSVLVVWSGSFWSAVMLAVSGMVPVVFSRARRSMAVDPWLARYGMFQVSVLPFMVMVPPVSGLYPFSISPGGMMMLTLMLVASSGPSLYISMMYSGDRP